MNDDEDIASFQDWALPAKEFHGLWERCSFMQPSLSNLRRQSTILLLLKFLFVVLYLMQM